MKWQNIPAKRNLHLYVMHKCATKVWTSERVKKTEWRYEQLIWIVTEAFQINESCKVNMLDGKASRWKHRELIIKHKWIHIGNTNVNILRMYVRSDLLCKWCMSRCVRVQVVVDSMVSLCRELCPMSSSAAERLSPPLSSISEQVSIPRSAIRNALMERAAEDINRALE